MPIGRLEICFDPALARYNPAVDWHNLRGTVGGRVIIDFSADGVDKANALTAQADGSLVAGVTIDSSAEMADVALAHCHA